MTLPPAQQRLPSIERIIPPHAPGMRIGLFGGTFSLPMPMFAFTGCQIVGSVTGSPGEMKEMMDLVTAGKVTPVPIVKRTLDEADATLQELRKGLIMGRAVLVP